MLVAECSIICIVKDEAMNSEPVNAFCQYHLAVVVDTIDEKVSFTIR